MKNKTISKTETFLKRTVAIILIALCLMPFGRGVKTAKAASLDYDDFDDVFLKTVEEYIGDNVSGEVALTADKEVIYDVDLNEMGYIYDFKRTKRLCDRSRHQRLSRSSRSLFRFGKSRSRFGVSGL